MPSGHIVLALIPDHTAHRKRDQCVDLAVVMTAGGPAVVGGATAGIHVSICRAAFGAVDQADRHILSAFGGFELVLQLETKVIGDRAKTPSQYLLLPVVLSVQTVSMSLPAGCPE